jgi:very-short-patch-repair endonuclease
MTPTMIADRLAAGKWELVLPSVYRIVGAPETREQRAKAACLYGGSGAVLIGPSAAAVWDLPSGRWTPPHIASPRQLKRRDGVLVARRLSLSPSEMAQVGPFPVTTMGRTLIDLVRCVNEETLERAIARVARRDQKEFSRLCDRIAELGRSRMAGIDRLRRLVQETLPTAGLIESDLEVLVARFIRRFRFPRPTLQHWVTLPLYGPARLDFAYPRLKVGVEAQSLEWHGFRSAMDRDAARLSEFASLGWIIIQTTWHQMRDEPEPVAQRLRRALDLRLGNPRSI